MKKTLIIAGILLACLFTLVFSSGTIEAYQPSQEPLVGISLSYEDCTSGDALTSTDQTYCGRLIEEFSYNNDW